MQLPFPYPVKWQDGSMTRHYNINHSGEYRLVVYDICGTKEYNFKVSYFPEEPLHLPLDTAFCEDDTVRIFAGNANSFFNYRWNDGSSLNYLDITHSGTYTVTKTGPCGSSAAQMNVSKNICNCPAYYPNVFTPDDNHINEVWKPLVCPTSNWHLQIYNRWGELIWETFDQQQGWDGRFGGVICMDGLYVFRNSYKTPWGEMNYHRGSFYLTR